MKVLIRQFSNPPVTFILSWVKFQIKILYTHIIANNLFQRNIISKRCPET
jgi:hypothetical protein